MRTALRVFILILFCIPVYFYISKKRFVDALGLAVFFVGYILYWYSETNILKDVGLILMILSIIVGFIYYIVTRNKS